MDINLLVLNVGNSRVAIGVFVEGELKAVRRVNLDDRANIPGIIQELWGQIAKEDSPAVAGASVNAPHTEWLEHAIKEATGQVVQWIGKRIDLPIKVLTEKPSQTGVDRVLNIAAAYEQMGKACVVVDAGTAITVDCCDDKGKFIGGSISPGINMMLDALHEKTAGLPRVEFSVPVEAFGQNTQQAILNGVYHGIRGMVKEVVENYATALGNWPDVIATGGDAQSLFEGWELIHAISPDLTLYGIALAYTNHQLKEDE